MKRLLVALMLVVIATPSFAAGKHAKRSKADSSNPCPHGIETKLFMVNLRSGHVKSVVNPFDNVGRCFDIQSMDVLQILSKSKALCGGREPLAMVDFGSASAPPNRFGGIVKGKGAYQYVSAMGALVTVHNFRLLSDDEQSAAMRNQIDKSAESSQNN